MKLKTTKSSSLSKSLLLKITKTTLISSTKTLFTLALKKRENFSKNLLLTIEEDIVSISFEDTLNKYDGIFLNFDKPL